MFSSGFLASMAFVVVLLAWAAATVLLLVLAYHDVKTRTISNKVLLVMVGVWVLWRVVALIVGSTTGDVVVLTDLGGEVACWGLDYSQGAFAVWGADTLYQLASGAIMFVALLAVELLYEAIAKRKGFGGGDMKLVALVALFVGIKRMPLMIVGACVFAIIYAFIYPRTKAGKDYLSQESGEGGYARKMLHASIPFAPAIAFGYLVALI